jgi:hypothetical protein
MKCFYHHQSDAVGLCKNCGRGLCPGCASEVPDGLACAGRCEIAAAELSVLIGRNANLSTSTKRGGTEWTFLGLFFVALGIIPAVSVFFASKSGTIAAYAAFAMLALASGLVCIVYGRRLNRRWAPSSSDRPNVA